MNHTILNITETHEQVKTTEQQQISEKNFLIQFDKDDGFRLAEETIGKGKKRNKIQLSEYYDFICLSQNEESRKIEARKFLLEEYHHIKPLCELVGQNFNQLQLTDKMIIYIYDRIYAALRYHQIGFSENSKTYEETESAIKTVLAGKKNLNNLFEKIVATINKIDD